MKLHELGVIAVIVVVLIGALAGTAIEEEKDLIDIVEEK